MELWIRSQDKMGLTKVNNIQVYKELENEIWIRNYDFDGKSTRLGIYNSKERALEVLDEIQTIMRGKYALTFDYKKESFRNFSPTQCQKLIENMAVYEMPKE